MKRGFPIAVVSLVAWLAAAVPTTFGQEGTESPEARTPTDGITEAAPSPTYEAPTPDKEATPIGGCAIGEPDRVVYNAIQTDYVIIAIAIATGPYAYETGAEADVIAVMEGDDQLADSTTTVDRRNGGPCFGPMWSTRAPMIGQFLVRSDDQTLATLRLWPVLLPDGSATQDIEAVRAVDPNQLLVELEDEAPITVAELMRRGREFVEPTPTPGPPRPTVAAIDTGGHAGVVAPNAGGGGAGGDSRRDAIIGIGAAVVAAAGAAGAFAMVRKRRPG